MQINNFETKLKHEANKHLICLIERIQSIRDTHKFIIEKVGKNKSWSMHIIGASCMGNLFVGMGKLVMGVLSLSFFTCVSAFYTFGMVVAKLCLFKGLIRENAQEKQCRYYKLSGMILIVASVLYVIYSTRLLWHPMVSHYDKYIGLGIVERHNHTLLFRAIRMINLASSLIRLVLTQTAILSFTHDTMPDYAPSVSNGLMEILMGTAATLIGCIMLWRVQRIKRKQETEENK